MQDKIVILDYFLTKPSRARKEKGEEVLTTEQYQAIALNGLLNKLNLSKSDLKKMKYGIGINRTLWPHALIWSPEVTYNLGLTPRLTLISDHGGMSAISLILQSIAMLKSGYLDIVFLIGADSPLTPAPLQGKWRLERTWRYEINYEMPIGMIGPISQAALIARRYIHEYKAEPEHFGKIAISFRENASGNPYAYLRQKITIDEYLKSPVIADPIRLLDTVIPINAGYSLAITTEEFAKKIGHEHKAIIKGYSSEINSEGDNELRDVTVLYGLKKIFNEALEMANLNIKKIDAFQLYDDFTVIVMMQIEDIGLAEKGEGKKFVENNDITYKGNVPINTGGGQLSGGQAGTAGGFSLVLEAVQQVCGEAEGRQVKGVKNVAVTGLGALAYNNNLLSKGVVIIGNE
ncbi:MAG: thiolase family protein [Sulfolobus sp.]|jgi:acetyl-CoA acetyltransferase